LYSRPAVSHPPRGRVCACSYKYYVTALIVCIQSRVRQSCAFARRYMHVSLVSSLTKINLMLTSLERNGHQSFSPLCLLPLLSEVLTAISMKYWSKMGQITMNVLNRTV
jgi:hypothetical protein